MNSSALAGGVVVAAVLILSTLFGLWRRRRDGAFRAAEAPEIPRQRATRSRDMQGRETRGRETRGRDTRGRDTRGRETQGDAAMLRGLGVEAGTPATLVQFSTAFCAPCRVTRRLASEVSALLPGVRHLDVDAESHLEAARALAIWRTPTVLVVDAAGRVASRAAGQPTKAQLIAAVGPLLNPEATR